MQGAVATAAAAGGKDWQCCLQCCQQYVEGAVVDRYFMTVRYISATWTQQEGGCREVGRGAAVWFGDEVLFSFL